MDIIEELKYYCSITNPVGALMLSGEWGCGKTYLIKNTFIPAVENEYVVLCVSLFGLDSIDAIKQEVKKQWLEKAGEIIPQDGARVLSKATDGYKKLFAAVKGILPEKLQDGGEAISSIIDLVKYMPVTNTMYEKKVILVFDDLERSNIPSSDLLGCINDYCENQHFNVVIVANEERIKESKDKAEDGDATKNGDTSLSYGDIKEKIIQRVIRFVPDYGEVVDNCIEALGKSEYTDFLKQNRNSLVRILAGDFDDKAMIEEYRKEIWRLSITKEEREKLEHRTKDLLNRRPHNIRSFKCAIQDFMRIYDLLKETGFKDCSNWLTSFTCCMMTSKAGLALNDSDYGSLFSDYNHRKLFPGLYNRKYALKSLLLWIEHGVWFETAIREELNLAFEREMAKEPVDILRTNDLLDVEDEIISQGFDELLNLAYSGLLSLDEYVKFIRNSSFARTCKVDIPEIDWERVKGGISIQLEKMESLDDDNDVHHHSYLDSDSKDSYTDDEWSSYRLIGDFWSKGGPICERNRRLYINLLENDLGLAFAELGDKRYDSLTSGMVNATYKAYEAAKNEDKRNFSGWFIGICSRIITMAETEADVNLTKQSLKELRAKLENLEEDYKEKEKHIAVWLTHKFINDINKVLCDRDSVTERNNIEPE